MNLDVFSTYTSSIRIFKIHHNVVAKSFFGYHTHRDACIDGLKDTLALYMYILNRGGDEGVRVWVPGFRVHRVYFVF